MRVKMATSKNARPIHETTTESFCLLANGTSGQWEVAIDESTSGANRWLAQIEGPSVSFCFEIPSVDIVGQILQFLDSHCVAGNHAVGNSEARNNSLVISKSNKSPIILVKDDEYLDRFFLVVGLMESPIVRFILAGPDVVQIANALRQVKEDLDDEA